MAVALLSAAPVSAAIPTAERNALIDLYNSTGGINWTHNAKLARRAGHRVLVGASVL